MDVKLNETETLRLYMWKNTQFSLSLAGEILNYANYFIRDILIFVLEIVLNVVSLITLKKHMSKKFKTFELQSQKEHSKVGSKVTNTPKSVSKVNETSFAISNCAKDVTNKKIAALKQAERSETNATFMIVIICILSGIEHLLFITMAIYFNYIRNETAFLIGALGNLGITLKHFSNFIIFYMFNRVFRVECNKLLDISFKFIITRK